MDIWQKLSNINRPIVLYGMGNGADKVLSQLQKYGKRPVGVFASNDFVRKQIYQGFTVSSYQELAKKYPDMIILVCFGSSRNDVLEFIERLSERHTVLCPDVPVYGKEIFDIDFAKKHCDELERVYQLLGDDLSRKTFENIVRFKLSGQTYLLRECEYDGRLFDPLTLSDDETYLDLGAYRGDTIEEFLSAGKTFRKIIAVEPNYKTYLKLCEKISGINNSLAIHAAISDQDGMGRVALQGRGSALGLKGQSVELRSVDGLATNESVSLIKMDVEGQEAAVLFGAAKTIKIHKPKMVVAAYHRSEDIFALPLLVHQIRPDYQILLRHNQHNLAWDTNYYFA